MAKGTWGDYFNVRENFWVIQLFDKAGYYKSVLASSRAQAVELAKAKTNGSWQGMACSLPFMGQWEGNIPDVSCPWDELKCLEGNQED
jgi:hypothetical protein